MVFFSWKPLLKSKLKLLGLRELANAMINNKRNLMRVRNGSCFKQNTIVISFLSRQSFIKSNLSWFVSTELKWFDNCWVSFRIKWKVLFHLSFRLWRVIMRRRTMMRGLMNVIVTYLMNSSLISFSSVIEQFHLWQELSVSAM